MKLSALSFHLTVARKPNILQSVSLKSHGQFFFLIWKIRGPWATMLTWVNSYKSVIPHFRLSVAMATNQNEKFVQLLYVWLRTTQQTFIKKFCQNTCSEIAIKTYFHISHYKSMETLSCHKSTWAMAIKNIIFEAANVMNISAKFQFYPPYGFRGEDF